jgi:hypothetical protein
VIEFLEPRLQLDAADPTPERHEGIDPSFEEIAEVWTEIL